MTKPHDMHHRPDCPRSGRTSSRVGSWLIERCKDCKATEIRKAEGDGCATQADRPSELPHSFHPSPRFSHTEAEEGTDA